jgi:hypothetical protein
MSGEVVYFFAYDVANEVVPQGLTTILGQRPAPLELRFKHGHPKDVAFDRPFVVGLPQPDARLAGRPIRIQIHIFDVGVVNIVVRFPVDLTDLTELQSFHRPVLDGGRTLADFARELFDASRRDLLPALIRPTSPVDPEAYTVFYLDDPSGDGDVGRWLTAERVRIAALLSDLSPDRVSEMQVAEVLRQTRSLEKCDLVVIDWDAALIVDVDGPPEDVLYVLEVANLQLEEFRMMDRALDTAFDRAYLDLERRTISLFRSPSRVLRELRWLRVNLTRLADEATNITKFVGDWYLARIYLSARERFHLDRWRQSVDGRLSQLDQLYSVVQSEVYERRMIWLELLIVIFFAIDLIGIFWWRR